MKKTTVLYLLVTAAIGFWLWSRFADDEVGRIRRRLATLEELVEKAAGEGALDGVGRARAFAELWQEPFTAVVAPAGQTLSDKAQLMQLFIGFRHASETVSLDYRNVEITVAPGGREALATLDAILNGGPGGLLADQSFPVELQWRKAGGQWLIARANVGEPERRGF